MDDGSYQKKHWLIHRSSELDGSNQPKVLMVGFRGLDYNNVVGHYLNSDGYNIN